MLTTNCSINDRVHKYLILSTSKGDVQHDCRPTITLALHHWHRTPRFSLFFLPLTDFHEFSYLPPAGRDILVDYIFATEIENNNSIKEASHDNKLRTWQRWVAWLQTMGWFNDPYINQLKRTQKARMIGAFVISIRRGEHSHPRHRKPLVVGTFSKAMSNLAIFFHNNSYPDPRTIDDSTTDRFVTGIIWSFRKVEPEEKAQKAATPQLLFDLYTRSSSTFVKKIANLCCGAFFFTCRFCEYFKTQGTHNTKP